MHYSERTWKDCISDCRYCCTCCMGAWQRSTQPCSCSDEKPLLSKHLALHRYPFFWRSRQRQPTRDAPMSSGGTHLQVAQHGSVQVVYHAVDGIVDLALRHARGAASVTRVWEWSARQ
jgi:hypothetical protein